MYHQQVQNKVFRRPTPKNLKRDINKTRKDRHLRFRHVCANTRCFKWKWIIHEVFEIIAVTGITRKCDVEKAAKIVDLCALSCSVLKLTLPKD